MGRPVRGNTDGVFEDATRCYRIVQSRDRRFDGCFVTAVRTTGIYCRPSCPATTPKFANVSFFATAAGAQLGGHRACKRCRPDASPGSPEWNTRSDLVARAMQLIADGVVDRDGVAGLATRLGYSERHVNRQLLGEVGAGPLALARSQRAQNARVLLETTDIVIVDVAFAAGFASLRQFNETVQAVFAATPTELRCAGHRRTDANVAESRPPSSYPGEGAAAQLSLRLAYRAPFSVGALLDFLALRCIEGVESVTGPAAGVEHGGHHYQRAMRLPHGDAAVTLSPADGHIAATLRLCDIRDLTAAVARCRRLFDLDADPEAVDAQLAGDPLLAPLVARRRGLRSPGAVSGYEMAVRAVLGQQVSVRGAIRAATALTARSGTISTVRPSPVPTSTDASSALPSVERPWLHFPEASAIAALDPDALAMPRQRGRALIAVSEAVADGRLDLEPGADRAAARSALVAVRGIGPWTADYVAMRALGDPDVWLGGDLVVRRRVAELGLVPSAIPHGSPQWAPWRTTVVHHLWASSNDSQRANT